MKIAIIGTGYVGLVSGVCLAYKGHDITCVDLRVKIVDDLNRGVPHIYEIDLEAKLLEVIAKEKFRATCDIHEALSQCDVIIIAVGTPSENGEIDLSQIQAVSHKIGEYIKTSDRYISVVVKSTVIPSTTDSFVKNAIEESSGKRKGEFGLGMNPEFLREGNAIEDFLNPDRIVLGFEDEITRKRLEEIYEVWDCDKLFVNTRTAEMIKYANNTLLASLISLNNELANLAGTIGNIDYNDVVSGVSKDKRWSPILDSGQRVQPAIISYMIPGAGFGGSCFPKDVQAIRTQGVMHHLDMKMTNSILDVNDKQAYNSITILKNKVGLIRLKKILILGLAFKPNTDDIRESSSVKIMEILLKEGCEIFAHDPIAVNNVIKTLGKNQKVSFVENWFVEVENGVYDIIIIGTNWDEYKRLKDLDNAGNVLTGKLIFDTKRLFSKTEIIKANYLTIGYNPIN